MPGSDFVHEIEIGDVDGDGVLEVYATPSEPNRLDGKPQSGVVVRYIPAKGEGRVVVADLGKRQSTSRQCRGRTRARSLCR